MIVRVASCFDLPDGHLPSPSASVHSSEGSISADVSPPIRQISPRPSASSLNFGRKLSDYPLIFDSFSELSQRIDDHCATTSEARLGNDYSKPHRREEYLKSCQRENDSKLYHNVPDHRRFDHSRSHRQDHDHLDRTDSYSYSSSYRKEYSKPGRKSGYSDPYRRDDYPKSRQQEDSSKSHRKEEYPKSRRKEDYSKAFPNRNSELHRGDESHRKDDYSESKRKKDSSGITFPSDHDRPDKLVRNFACRTWAVVLLRDVRVVGGKSPWLTSVVFFCDGVVIVTIILFSTNLVHC